MIKKTTDIQPKFFKEPNWNTHSELTWIKMHEFEKSHDITYRINLNTSKIPLP